MPFFMRFASMCLVGALAWFNSQTAAVRAQQPDTRAHVLTPLPVSLLASTRTPHLQIQPQQHSFLRVQRDSGLTTGPSTTGWVQTEQRKIEGDAHRAYMLLSPGGRGYSVRRRLRLRADGTIIDVEQTPPNASKPVPPETPSAGLLVVLPNGEGDSGQAMQFWGEVMRNVLKGRYYVAIASAPHWEGPRLATWLTESNVKQVKEARFSTEGFAADIVRDVSASYNIDPQRVFLHGAAESGLAAYACSLTEATLFKGFYIHDSAFRSGQLPPLTHARQRRYFLQQSQDDKTNPLWMAEAARKMLADQGATVKLAPYHGNGAYNFSDSRWERIGEAITWLEAGNMAAKSR